jgi:hypothetical protein
MSDRRKISPLKYVYWTDLVAKGAALNRGRARWVAFLGCLFLGMALLTFALVVYHLPPLWFGLLYLLLLVGALFAGKSFLGTRQNSAQQRGKPVPSAPMDDATRRRLRSALLSAKFFVVLFTLGFVFFIGELMTGSRSIPWWAKLESGVIGLLLLSWSIRQVIYLKKRLGQPRT